MVAADQVCARELAVLSANQRTISASLSATETALSSAATVVTGGLADNILSAMATLVGSTRGHLNSEVFRGARAEAITLLIQADRQDLAYKLIGPEAKEREFTNEEAIYFANQYHQSCSLYNGLALLTEAAQEKASRIQSGLDQKNDAAGGESREESDTSDLP